jgi:asparagine synthase (glutamine-hydrolysing)
MCGIAGFVGAPAVPQLRVDDALRRMRRRGPDHAAAVLAQRPDGTVAQLLHTRLSIVDLDPRSHQPFERGPWLLAFNGEIYNFVEIRADLESRGHTFHTRSDTEVLAAALDEYGVMEALDRFEGMWAFAAVDRRDGAVWLARDRFGEKPLYVHVADEGVYFGSEPKQIASLSGQRFAPNLDQIRRFLVNGYKALYKRRSGFFHGIDEVEPGTVLVLRPGCAPETLRYWTPRLDVDPSMTFERAVEGARAHLQRAVGIRLRADVPLAFCMSGGVDSVSLISMAKRVFDYDVHAFTIVVRDERYAETETMAAAVRDLGIRHTTVQPRREHFLGQLRELVRYHDAPVYTLSYYLHWLLMREIAAHGYRVSVSGTGADELFSGYYDHHLFYIAGLRDDPAALEEARANWEWRIRPYVRNPFLSDPDRFLRDPQFREHIYLDAQFFAGLLREPWREPFEERDFGVDLLRNRMLNELFHEAVPVILHEDDLNAMYWSIENRSPYLDRGLMEFCFSIPSRHLIRNGFGKAVLREAMRGIAPGFVINAHRKVGFNAPIAELLDVNDRETRELLLDPSPIFDILDRAGIEKLLCLPEYTNSRSKFLFYFVSAKAFLEEFSR